MTTILEALKGISSYPIPFRTLVETAEGRGLSLADEATAEVLAGKAFRLATADLLLWLSLAPNISQGGQSYSFSEDQRQQMRNRSNAIAEELEPEAEGKSIYGYKGSSL